MFRLAHPAGFWFVVAFFANSKQASTAAKSKLFVLGASFCLAYHEQIVRYRRRSLERSKASNLTMT
jgi:hypothetical protein